MHTCPVCGYNQLRYPPEDFTICPSCGTEFGYHDSRRTHWELRVQWVNEGALWHSRVINPPSPLWNGLKQLIDSRLPFPYPYGAGFSAQSAGRSTNIWSGTQVQYA